MTCVLNSTAISDCAEEADGAGQEEEALTGDWVPALDPTSSFESRVFVLGRGNSPFVHMRKDFRRCLVPPGLPPALPLRIYLFAPA